MEQSEINRRELLKVAIPERRISNISIHEITFPPAQRGAYHLHPCTVVGHVVSGSILFQVEGEEAVILKSGDAFCEPADKPITHFDNHSETEPVVFIACYLLNGDQELIRLLP